MRQSPHAASVEAQKLTVAICTRNRPNELADCLASVFESPAVEAVVVSSDGVDKETEDVVASARSAFQNLRFVRGPQLGLAANRNSCVEETSSPYLLFLDDDALLRPSFVDAALPLVGPDRIVTGWESQNGRRINPHHADLLGFQRLPADPPLRAIVINSTIFPTSQLRRFPFDEFYRFGCEEIDVALAAVARGLQIIFVDEGNEHRHIPSSREGNRRLIVRSRAYFNVRRFTAYEPHAGKLAHSVVRSAANAVAHGVKTAGPIGGLLAGCDVTVGAGTAVVRRRQIFQILASPSLLEVPLRPKASVVVATYRRPHQLRACLRGLRDQDLQPDEVVVVYRPSDIGAAEVLRDEPWARGVAVDEPGQVAALRAGAEGSFGEVVAFIDDDAIPRRDWLRRLMSCYDDPAVAAVGGRDIVWIDGRIVPGAAHRVGRLSTVGRLTGNHHLGVGRARDVDVLKGCNSSYRRSALAFPLGLRGSGAQVANDLATSLRVATQGHRVVFEPRALIDHYPGRRFDHDARDKQAISAHRDRVFNETYAIGSIRPDLLWRRLLYVILVGDRGTPGIIRTLAAWIRGEREVTSRFIPSIGEVVAATRAAIHSPLTFSVLEQPIDEEVVTVKC